jgi:hypothetical protein
MVYICIFFGFYLSSCFFLSYYFFLSFFFLSFFIYLFFLHTWKSFLCFFINQHFGVDCWSVVWCLKSVAFSVFYIVETNACVPLTYSDIYMEVSFFIFYLILFHFISFHLFHFILFYFILFIYWFFPSILCTVLSPRLSVLFHFFKQSTIKVICFCWFVITCWMNDYYNYYYS